MANDNYVEFLQEIPEDKHKIVARELGLKIRSFAKVHFSEVDDEGGEALARLFNSALEVCGTVSKYNSEEYYGQLVKDWIAVNKSKNLAIEVYYYLHTIKAGQRIAQSVDDIVFKCGFEEMTGFPVPGGFQNENQIRNDATEHHKIAVETYNIVRNMAVQIQEIEQKAAIKLLTSLATQYGEDYSSNNVIGLENYLKEKIDEWRTYRIRISVIDAEDEADAALLAKALEATDNGDFETAEVIFASSQERFDNRLEAALKATGEAAKGKAERLALRGNNAALSGDKVAAARFFDQAHDTIQRFDDLASIRYAHHAANHLYSHASRSPEVKLTDVASRYRNIIERVKKHPNVPVNQIYGPILSYSALISTAFKKGQRSDELITAERICRDCLSAYGSHHDIIVPAIIKSVLGRILTDRVDGGFTSHGLKESLSLSIEALEVITPESCNWFWSNAQNSLGSTLMSWSRRYESLQNWEKTASVYKKIIEIIPVEKNYTDWARACHNFGTCAYHAAIISKNQRYVHISEKYLTLALTERRRDREPLLYARTQSMLGLLNAEKYNIGGHVHIDSAIHSFTEAAEIWRPDQQVVDWWYDNCRLIAALCVKASYLNEQSKFEVVWQRAKQLAQRLADNSSWAYRAGKSMDLHYRRILKMPYNINIVEFNFKEILMMKESFEISMST